VGPLTATALVAAVGNAQRFKNGRELSAYLGLVPRQHSSGGKTVLLGITKRGDRYLRILLRPWPKKDGQPQTVKTASRKLRPSSFSPIDSVLSTALASFSIR
jgi:transposase